MIDGFPEGHFGHMTESAFDEAALQKKNEDCEGIQPPPPKRVKLSGGVPQGCQDAGAGTVAPKREVVEPKPRTSSTAVSTGGEGDQKSENKDEDNEPVDENELFGSDEDGEAGDEDTQEELGTGGSCFGDGVGEALPSLPQGIPIGGRSWWANGLEICLS